MPAAIAPACLLCGLQFTSMPLLVLHIREDHVHAHARTPDVRVAKDQAAGPRAGPVMPEKQANVGSPALGSTHPDPNDGNHEMAAQSLETFQ
jgi:hypothetical protein